MALFGGSRKTRQSASLIGGQTRGVSSATRAARARKGHQKRASHLFVSGNSRGSRTTYRKSQGRLF